MADIEIKLTEHGLAMMDIEKKRPRYDVNREKFVATIFCKPKVEITKKFFGTFVKVQMIADDGNIVATTPKMSVTSNKLNFSINAYVSINLSLEI